MIAKVIHKPTCVIFNAAAGARGYLPREVRRLIKGSCCEFRATTAPGAAKSQARAAIESGVERIIVAGGDGTASHVINGIAPDFSRVEMALLPLGTGNDLARSLGIPTDRLEDAVTLALSEQVSKIDLVRVTLGRQSYMVNAASGGFGGKVAADVQQVDKTRWGAFAYWMTAVTELVDMRQFDVHLDLDDCQRVFRVFGMWVTNGRFVGGGFPIAPDALLDDGLLNVTVVPVLPTMELLAAGLNFMLHRPQGPDQIQTLRARQVRVTASPQMPFSFDGEPTERIDASFEVLPQALRIVTGEGAVGLAGDAGRQ